MYYLEEIITDFIDLEAKEIYDAENFAIQQYSAPDQKAIIVKEYWKAIFFDFIDTKNGMSPAQT